MRLALIEFKSRIGSSTRLVTLDKFEEALNQELSLFRACSLPRHEVEDHISRSDDYVFGHLIMKYSDNSIGFLAEVKTIDVRNYDIAALTKLSTEPDYIQSEGSKGK